MRKPRSAAPHSVPASPPVPAPAASAQGGDRTAEAPRRGESSPQVAQQLARLGLGELRHDYPDGGALRATAGIAVWTVFVLLAVVSVLLVAVSLAVHSGGPLAAAVVATALTLLTGLFGIRLRAAQWRGSARRGTNRCYLFTGGVAVTDRQGRIKSSTPWSETLGLYWAPRTESIPVAMLIAFVFSPVVYAFYFVGVRKWSVSHRLDMLAQHSGIVTFTARGSDPGLITDLLQLHAMAVFPQALRNAREGTPEDYGPFDVGPRGLTHQGELIPWGKVWSCALRRDRLEIVVGQGRRLLVRAAEVPNVQVFQGVVRALAKEAGRQ
jgi:hypothetical protein